MSRLEERGMRQMALERFVYLNRNLNSMVAHTYRHTHTHLCAKIQRVLNYSVRMEGRLSTAQRGNRKMEASV